MFQSNHSLKIKSTSDTLGTRDLPTERWARSDCAHSRQRSVYIEMALVPPWSFYDAIQSGPELLPILSSIHCWKRNRFGTWGKGQFTYPQVTDWRWVHIKRLMNEPRIRAQNLGKEPPSAILDIPRFQNQTGIDTNLHSYKLQSQAVSTSLTHVPLVVTLIPLPAWWSRQFTLSEALRRTPRNSQKFHSKVTHYLITSSPRLETLHNVSSFFSLPTR